MNNTGIRAIAQQLQAQGRGRDKILAHIMPEEAAMLKRMGGRGTVNPATGLLEFDNPSMGAYDSPSSGGVSPGLSGFGGGSSSPSGVSGGGFSSPTAGGGGGGYSSVGGGGYTSRTGGDGGGSMAAARSIDRQSVPGYAAPTPAPISGSSNYLQSLGVPTIVANAASTVGQSLLNFSDWSTGQYRQMMGGLTPSTTVPSTPGFRSEAAFEAAAAPRSNIDPVTGRDYGREAVQRSIAWGEALGGGIASLRDMLSAPAETVSGSPGFRSEAASGGYDFTPTSPQVPLQLDPGGSGRMVTPTERDLFYEMQSERFNDQYGRPAMPAPEPTESIQISQPSPTPQGPPGFRSEAATGAYSITPVSLPGFRSEAALEAAAAPAAGMSLEGLPPGRLGTFDMQTAIQQYRQALNNIQVPTSVLGVKMMVNPGPYVNDPENKEYYQSNEVIAQKILDNLPLAGLRPGPNGEIETIDGGMPSGEQMAKVFELATRSYNVPSKAMPPGSTGQMTLDPRQFVDVRSVPMPPERPAEEPVYAGPPGFRSEVAQNVAQSLDAEFENLTKSASLIEGPQTPAPTTRGISAPEQSAFNLPTFAQVPLGSPMAFPETGAAAPTYAAQPAAPANIVDYSTERMTDPRMQPANLRSAIENASLYYGMGYPSLVNMQVTPAGTAGMLANIQRESSFNPAAYNPKEFGFGFAQYQQKAALPAAGRLNSFLQGLNIDPTSLPTDKNARAAAIQSALANTDTEQIGYMLNEIATTKYYAPTYRAMTQEGVTPSQAATTYMRNFEGAKVVPSAQDIALGNEEAVRAQLNARIAAQAANAERIARTQFAGTQLSPTVSRSIQTSGLTSPQTTQAAIQNGELGAVLDQGWKEVIAAIGPADLPSNVAVNASNNVFGEAGPTFSGGGGRDTQPFYRTATREPEQLPVEETTPPVYTTGMDLTRRTYTPRLPTETISPAYS